MGPSAERTRRISSSSYACQPGFAGRLPKWHTAYGGFTTDGTYAISGTPPVNGNWANVVPVYGTDDYSVTADLIVPSGSTYSGIVARSSDPVEFDRDLYAAQLAANGTVNLYRRNAWGWTLLRSVAAGIVSNTRYTVKLVTSGYDPAVHLEVWVNGTQRISFDDTSSWRLAGGSAGMENYNASVKYTNFSVDTIGTTPPPTSYTVNVSVTGSGSVNSSPSGINCPSGSCSMAVTSGTNVTLTATPAAGYAFQGWGGACTGTGTCSLSVTSDRSVSAQFRANRTYPCGQQPCARGQFPPASWRPYADTSPFNTGVPSNAALIPSSYCSAPIPAGSTCSREMVGRLLGDISNNNYPAHWLVAFDGMTGWPTYYGITNDPTFNVTCNEYLKPGQTSSCPSMPSGKAPGGAVVQGASNPLGGSDKHLTFIDQDTELEFDLWHVQTSPLPYNGGTVQTGYSGYTTITGDGRSLYGDGNAGRFGNLAGRIRIEEMTDAIARKSYINHALTIAVNCTSGQWIYPANGNSGRSCSEIGLANGNAPPMGAHIHLDMTLADIDGDAFKGVPEWKKVLLRTLAVYGAYVNDTGSDFYFSWQLESGIQYTSMGVADPWRAFASSLTNSTGTNDWWDWNDEWGSGYKGLWNTSNGIDDWETQVWSGLRVLAQ